MWEAAAWKVEVYQAKRRAQVRGPKSVFDDEWRVVDNVPGQAAEPFKKKSG